MRTSRQPDAEPLLPEPDVANANAHGMSTRVTNERASGSERLYYRPREVANLTGLGLRTIYANIYAGIIPSRKIGDARLIPASWLLAQTDAEAEDIRHTFAPSSPQSAPKNR